MARRLEEVVATRVTVPERRLLEASAARRGISLARLVRALLTNALEEEFGKAACETAVETDR